METQANLFDARMAEIGALVIPAGQVLHRGRLLATRTPDGRRLLHVETRHAGGAWLELTAEDVAWLREVLE